MFNLHVNVKNGFKPFELSIGRMLVVCFDADKRYEVFFGLCEVALFRDISSRFQTTNRLIFETEQRAGLGNR